MGLARSPQRRLREPHGVGARPERRNGARGLPVHGVVLSSRRDELAKLPVGRPHSLPSGRRVVVRLEDDGETLEVVSPGGDIEVGIRLTPEGPVLKLRGARLEIDSTETVAINCRRFELSADEVLELRAGAGVAVQSDADIQFRSEGQTHIDGDWVNINCDERAGTGWHDDPLLLEAGGRGLSRRR